MIRSNRARAGLALLAALGLAPAVVSVDAGSGVTVIRGATVLTVTKGVIEGGTVVVRDGRIAAVGKELPVPAGARVVEARRRFLVPGFIAVDSGAGIRPAPPKASGAGGAVRASAGGAMAKAADSIWSDDPALLRAVAGGVTTIQLLPRLDSAVGGETAILKLKAGKGRDGMLLGDAPPGLAISFVEGGTGPAAEAGRAARGRDLRTAFARAAVYGKAQRGDAEGRAPASGEARSPKRDLFLQALVDAMAGKVRVYARCELAAEIVGLFELAGECGFKLDALFPALEAYKVADTIAAKKAAVATPVDIRAGEEGSTDAIAQNAALLLRKGVVAAIGGGSAKNLERLNQEAARQMRDGALTRDEAFSLITINPARILGLDGRIGSIETGKDADLVLFDRDPASVYARVEMTMIDGEVVYDRDRDYERFVAAPPISPPPVLPAGPSGRAMSVSAPASPMRSSREQSVAAAPAPVLVGPSEFIVTAAKVFAVSSPMIEGGAIWVKDGKIHQVGKIEAQPGGSRIMTCVDGCALQIREDMPIVDAAGKWIFPGLIDASVAGLGAGRTVGRSGSSADHGFVAARGRQPLDRMANLSASPGIAAARVSGITSAIRVPEGRRWFEGGDPFQDDGLCEVIDLAGGTQEEMIVRSPAGIHVDLCGEGGQIRPGAGWLPEAPADRAQLLLRRALLEARVYRAQSEASSADPSGRTKRPDKDPRKEALIPVLTGELPLIVRANRAGEIQAAIRIADEFGLRMILEQGTEAWKVAGELFNRRIPVLVGPISAQPDPEQAPGAIYENAARLVEAGVRIAIRSGTVLDMHRLRAEAGLAVAYGLPWDEAIRAVTLSPAEIFGVDGRVGSLSVDAEANFLIADGDPLEIVTHVERVFIRGVEASMTTRELDLYRRYRN